MYAPTTLPLSSILTQETALTLSRSSGIGGNPWATAAVALQTASMIGNALTPASPPACASPASSRAHQSAPRRRRNQARERLLQTCRTAISSQEPLRLITAVE